MPTLTKEIIEAAIYGFEAQKKSLDAQIVELRGMLNGGGSAPKAESAAAPAAKPSPAPKRTMSAAGRKAIAEAQRKRWAAARGETTEAAPAKAVTKTAKKRKRRLSPEGRAAI